MVLDRKKVVCPLWVGGEFLPQVEEFKYLGSCSRVREGWSVRLTGGSGQVIFVYGAHYGRRDQTTCSRHQRTSAIQNVACSIPVTQVAQRCNGQNSCTVKANNSVFGDPCAGTYKYLEVAYICQGDVRNCGMREVLIVYTANYGRRDHYTCSYQKPDIQIKNTNCLNPTSKIGESCNGKNSCTIKASNSVFGDPCVGTYKYLELVYKCQCK
uniref:SUEL-type lectin domain-containing protein n=1 Tax=Sphaeramia orbicularis TaxID=375764 RepID=A0A672ZM26_9TELE